jgi:sugar phosphate isomerase/epimerase
VHRGGHGGGRLVPRNRLGVQQWSVRDAITRLDRSASGYLGGPRFPEDPTDLGPLVPLPGGFAAVFRYLASVGYRGFEFFSFDQGAGNGPITDAEIRAALDRAGLVAAGSHTGGLQQMVDPALREAQIERARILGLRMIGTAGNPADPTTGLLADWQRYAEQANAVGTALRAVGIKYFFHPEQDWFRLFSDPAHPELDRVHRIDWFTDHTDPRLVFFEPDTMHTLAGRARFPDPVDGRLFDVDAWYGRLAARRRIIAWHVKDADRVIPLPAPGTNPFTQTRLRSGFPLNGGTDVVYVGEGSVGRGYPVDPDPQVRGFAETFSSFRLGRPGWFHTESDSGPGPTADPGRSLRWAKVSAAWMLALEADRDDRCGGPRRPRYAQ